MEDRMKIEKDKKTLELIRQIDDIKIKQSNHFMISQFEDAIKTAEIIIEIAQKGELMSIVREQEAFIEECKALIIKKEKTTIVKEAFEFMKPKFETLIKEGNIIEGHQIVIDFIQKFEESVPLNSITSIRSFLLTERDIWTNFTDQQNGLKKRLYLLETSIQNNLDAGKIDSAEEILPQAQEALNEVVDDAIKEKWINFKKIIKTEKEKREIITQVELSISESEDLREEFAFKSASEKLEDIIEKVKLKNLPDYLKQLELKKQQILDAERKYNTLLNELSDLEVSYSQSINSNQTQPAIFACERIIEISKNIRNQNKAHEYSERLHQLKKRLQEEKLAREYNELKAKIKILNEEALTILADGKINQALVKFEKIKQQLIDYIN